MAYINIAVIAGFLGDEPKVITSKSGSTFVTFSLASTKRGYTTKNGTTIPDRTDWHNIVVFGNLAKIAQQYLHKGSSVIVRGEIHTRKYVDNNNVNRYVTEIEADDFQMLDRKGETSVQQNQTAQQSQQTLMTPAMQSAIDQLQAAGFDMHQKDDLPC